MSRRPQQIDYSVGFLKAARSGNLEEVLEYLKWNIDVNVGNANGLTALHLASKEGHDHVVSELIRRRANIEAQTRKGNTPLHVGALGGHEPAVRILVENGANINAKSQDGFTPLYMAAQENHLDVVKYLLERNADHTLVTRDGYTPLAVALQLGHDDIVGVLMDQDTVMQTKTKLPPLHRAAKKDDVPGALSLLQKERQSTSRVGGGIVNEITKNGFTPLHTAAHHGNTRVGRVLIENGADIDFKARNMVTPLHVASKWGRHNMVQLLLDSGANLACLTKDELTPLHCAARSGHDNVANILLQRGSQVNAKSKSKLSPLHMSAQGDHVECAELFLGRNAPIDDVTIDYLTPLHVTAHCGSVKTCKLLLDRKCEVNARALNGFTPLHIACKKNRIKIIELLLRYGGVIDSTTETGLTPLHVASFMGHMSIVKLLLEKGADPNTPNERGETSLHLAARGDQTEIMAVLLDSGAEADAKAKELQTALHIAARQGNAEAVDQLLKRGASPNNATKDLYTPLHIAVREGHMDIAKMLLDHDANPGLTTKKGFTPLHIAAKHGQLKLAQLLVQRGVHPDIKGRNDLTPLHVATHYGNADIVNYLLNKGASAVPSTKNGYTPLHIAAKKDHTDIASTLMERGAKPGCESRNGFTPLHLAAKEGHVRMVKLLFSRGADANCRAKNGLTPMHLAAQEDHVPVAELLVKHNAQIDPPTKAGYTPLHTACHFGQINMIQFLLEHGASVNATTKVGNTPLHQAAQQGHVMVINLLLRYRANPNAVNATGQTPLSIAQHLGFLSVVETLNKITEVVVTPNAMAGRYKKFVPETMQESTMIELDEMKTPYMHTISEEDEMEPHYQTWGQPGVFRSKRSGQPQNVRNSFHGEDGEDESFRNGAIPGSDTLPSGGFQYLSVEDGRPRSASPSFRDDSDIFGFDKTLDRYGSMSFCDYHALEDEMKYMREPMASAVDELADQYAGTMPMSVARQTKTRAPPPEQFEKAPMQFAKQPEIKTLTRRPPSDEDVAPDFLADANGGVMEGPKPAGVRIIVPPGAVTTPTRFACRLIRVEKLKSPPSLLEGEDLATRILEMEPIGTKFNRPILVDVPHFASLRGREREILVLRCDDGKTWQEHVAPLGVSESDVLEIVKARFKDVEPSDELYKKRISRILATDLPQYFALVTRVTKDQSVIDSRGGTVVSSNSPQVKVTVPNGSLTRSTKMGLQIQPISEDMIARKRPSSRATAASPIVTVEPRRHKFNKPLTVTMPLPAKRPHGDASTLRLLRNSSDGKVPAEWEDITASTPLTILNDTATFSTPASASFWLLDCPNASDSTRIAAELYPEAILVPFMAKFVVCGRRHLPTEARLRVFCMTGDVLEKTMKRQGRFKELARSREVEVLNKTPQYLELDGNLEVVKKSKKQPSVFFRALRANGVPIVVRIRSLTEDPTGRLAFMLEQMLPKGQGHRVQDPVCSTIVTLPVDVVPDALGEAEDEDLENRIPGDDSQGYSDGSRESSVSDNELSPGDREALRKKIKRYASDLDSEPDIIGDQNGRFKRQEPGNTDLFVNTSPVKIDFIPDDKAYASISVPTDTARILTRPEAKAYKTIDGGTRLVTDVVEHEHVRKDGFTIKEKITTTKHLKTVTEITLTDGVPSNSQSKETLILTEVEENISELPPGITSLLSPDIQTETTEKDLQSTLPDGSLVKKKTIRTVGRLKPTAAKRGQVPEEKGPKVTKELVEGDLVPRSKVEESQKTRADGVTEKLKVVTTQYFKPVTEITFTDGVETGRQSSERLDNVNIEENILELPSGVIAPNADNCDTDISIDTKEYTMPDGTPVKKRTVRMIVTLKRIPEKQVSVQRTEGDIRSVSDVVTDQENMDNGRKARKRKLITTKHYKPITEVTFTDGVPSEPVTHEEFIGADIDENILELSAGVIEPYAENCDTKISLESCEFALDEGAPAKKTLVTMTVAPKPLTSDVALSIVEGPIEPRSETRISEGKLTNGGTVRRKIVKTIFVNPVREVTVVDNVSKSRLLREEVVGVEVVENVLEMPPGITEPNGKNVATKTTMTKSEETLPNGKVAKKKIIRTVAELVEGTITYDEGKPVAAKRKGKSPSGQPSDDVIGDNLTRRIIEGEIEPRVDVVEDEQKLDNGVVQKRKVVTTRFIKPLYEITLTNGMPPESQKIEEVVNAEIKENILELDYGVVESNAANCDADISVAKSEVQLPEGVPAKKKTTKITVKLPEDGKREATDYAKRRKQLPKENRQLIEGDIQLRPTVSENRQTLSDGGTVQQRTVTTKHIKPVTEIITKEGRPPQKKEWEELVATDIEENVLRLPAGVIEPDALNCDINVSVDKSQITLPDGNLANKTVTEIVVKMRDPSQPPRERWRKRKTGDKDKDQADQDVIEGPIEQRTEVKNYKVTRKDGGDTLYKVVTTSCFRSIFKVSTAGGRQSKTKLREDLVSIDIVENILELPAGVTDVNRTDVKTEASVTFTEETLPDGVPVRKRVVRTVGVLLSPAELPSVSPAQQKKVPETIVKVIEGEIEPRTETEKDEQNLNDGTTIARKTITTKYVKPTIEIKIARGQPPESTAKEEVVRADVSENILELPCGVIEPYGENCETDISAKDSEETSPENVPLKKKTRRIVVTLIPEGGKEGVPGITKQRIEGEIVHRPSTVEDKEDLSDGGTVWRKVTTTKHVKPITEITNTNGIPTDTKKWEEVIGTNIDENILQLPAGVIEPNSSNCDIDVNVETSQVTLPDGSLADKTVTKTVVTLRAKSQPRRKKLRKRKWKPGRKISAKGIPEEDDVIEGPVEARTEVKEFENKTSVGGVAKHREVITTYFKTFMKVYQVGGVEKKTKLREEIDGREIVENVLELPPGVADVNRHDVATDTTVSYFEYTLPEGAPATKKLVKTVATLLEKSKISSKPENIPDVIYKSVEGKIEPRIEYEEEEQNLDDGTTLRRNQTTTKYVKPTTEVKLVRGLPPESTTKEEVVKAEVSENILELPCGVIDPCGENCETKLSVSESNVTLPENIPAEKKTTRMAVTLKPSKEGKDDQKTTKNRIGGEIEHRPSTVEDKEDLNDGGTVWRKVTTTKHVKPITEITSVDGIPIDTRQWEELVGTDIEENVLQLPAGVIEPNSSNCDIDVNVEKSQVTLPDGSQANKVTIRTLVKLRDAFQPPKRKGKKRKWRPSGKGAAEKRPKDKPDFDQENIIEGPIESRTDVNESEVKANDGGTVKYRVVTTTNVKTFFKVVQRCGKEEREKLREEVDSKEIVENILVLPAGVTDVKQRNVKTNSTVTHFEETLPEGIPLRKTVVRTVAALLGPGEQPVVTVGSSEAPDVLLKSVEGEIEPRIEVEEDENNLPDGTTLKRSKITTKYVQPVTEIKLVSGLPPESTVKETVVDADIKENILELPCGLIEPFGENCATDFSEAVSDEKLPGNVPAKKKTTTMVVTLRPPGEDGKTKVPKITKKLKEGDVVSRFVMAEEKETHDDGSSTQRKLVTVRHFKPFADITYQDGVPISTKHWEELVGIDIEENVLKLPAGVIEPNASNCDIDISVEKFSDVLLPDGHLANKTVTTTAVSLRDPKLPPRQKQPKRKRRPGRKGEKLPSIPEEEPGLIEGPIETRSEVKEHETKGRDGGLVKHRIVTTISIKPILKVSKVRGKEVQTKVREKLDSKDIVENILELPPGVTDISRPDVKTDTTLLSTEDLLPGDVPVTKKTVRTVASLLTKAELAETPVRPSSTPGMVYKVLEGEIEPRTEIEEDEQNLNDGTTVARVTVTTRYVKPVTEVRIVSGQPPQSTTREEIQRAEVSENILELPCGVIDPFASNCDRDITVTASEVVLPEGTPAKKTTTRMVVQLRQPAEGVVPDEEKRAPTTYAKKPGVPEQSTKVLEGEIEARSETSESQKTLDDGSNVTHRVVITRYIKPITEVISVDGVTTEEKHREELVGTDIDETITQLPVGVIEPNSRNCDVDVTVDKSRVTLPDGSPANRVVTKMIVKLRDPKKPKREKLKKRKYKPGKKHALKEKAGVQDEDTIEGPIEARTKVQEYEVATKDGGLQKYRVVTTTKVKSILKVSKVGTVETKTKLREEVDSVEITENILELPSGVTDISQRDVTTDTTLTSAEETLPDGVPVTKKVVRTVARLLTEPEIAANAESNELPDNVLKVIEGEVEPRQEVEEDEQALNDGRTIRQIVVTTKYVKPITEVRISDDGPPESSTREEVVDADVNVNIFDLPSGVISPNASNCQQDTSVDTSEVLLPDGTPATKKTSKTVISLRPPGSTPQEVVPRFTDKPSELTRKITEGEIKSKSVTAEDQESLEEGGTQKRKVITTTYVKPITEQIMQDGLTLETNTFEEVVGTDIEENILRLPAGKIEPNAANCETDLAMDAFEIDLPDGNVARKFFAMLVVKLKDPQDAKTSSAKKPISSADSRPASQNVVEGPIQSRTDSKTFHETSPKGGIVTHNIVTTTYFKPIIEVTTVNGIEKRNVLKEETVNLEIVENILELPPGMKEFDSRNTKADTTVDTSEDSLPNGTPVTKRIVKTVVWLPTEPFVSTDHETPSVIHKVIDGEVKSKSEVVENQQNLDDGRAIVRKVATTRQVKPVTEVKLAKGCPPESTTREETVAVDVREHILELPSGVIEPNGKNCDVDITVDKTDDLTPDNVPTKQKTVSMKVNLRPSVGKKFPQVRIIEGDVRVSKTVKEFEENLDDGAVAKHKIITTQSVKPITEVTSLDGLTVETKDREEIVSTEIEENILQLPAGVIEPNASNCVADLSVDTSDVVLPDGNLARKTTIKVIVQLKKPSSLTAATEPERLVKPAKPGEEVKIIEGDIVTNTEVTGEEKVTDDGTTVRSKVITMTHSRPIIQIVTVNGEATRTILREKTTGVDVIENILKLLPGVTDPRDAGVKTATSIKTCNETLPTGVPLQREIIETVASPPTKEPGLAEDAKFWPQETAETPDVTLRILEGPVEAKSEVKEDQRNLDDGRTIKQKSVTTRYVKPVTEVTMVDDNAPESTTKEELVKGDVKQIILDLPCGTIEPFGKNCETDITVEDTSVMLPENRAVPKKIVKMTVHLAEPSTTGELESGKPKVTKKLVDGKITSKSSTAEDEQTLSDGTVVKQKVITTKFFKPVTEITLVDGEPTDSVERVELVDCVIDETVLQLSPGVIEPNASNCDTDISFENSEVVLPDGTKAKKRLTRIVVRIKESSEEEEIINGQLGRTKIVEGPVEQKTKVYKDEKKIEDGSTVRRKVITTRHVKPVLEVVIVNGKQASSRLREERLVLTEIEENILQLPPGIKDVYGNSVQTKSTATDFEDAASDGTPVKRKVIKTIAYVAEGPEAAVLATAEGIPTNQVIEGPVQSRTTVKEDQKDMDDGVTRKEKVVTTVYFRPFTEVILSEGSAPDSQVREEVIRTLIDECILELPAGVIEPFAKNCDTEIKVDNLEYTALDGSPVIKKVVLMTVTLKKEFLEEMARKDTSIRPTGSSSRQPETKLIEGEIEPRTKVAEEQENLPNGVTLKRKFITTTYVKPVTEIVVDDGGAEISRNFKEIINGVDKEEHTLELPCGVIEPYASNCDTNISVTNSKETQPDGIVANKKVVKMTVTLKETAPFEEEDTAKPRKPRGKKVLEGPVEPRVSIRQKQETRDDGTKIRSKITTTQYFKSVTEIPVIDGVESEGKTKEVPVSIEIVTDVLQLHPSVSEPYVEQATESNVTVKHSEEISADGLPVRQTIKTTVVTPKTPGFAKPSVKEVTRETVNGDIRSQTSVTEDEKDLDDGSTIKRKVITTIYIIPITEVTLVNGVETEATTKEEVVRAEIEEHVLQLPTGLIEPHADNCDIDISVRTFEDRLPDGAPAKKKLVSTVVKLKDSAGFSVQSQKTIEGDVRTVKDVAEDEKVTEDGRTIRTRTITTKWLKSVTEVSLIKGIEVKSKTREVVVRTEIDENILELPPNVKDENRSDLESQTSVEQGEVVLPDGTVAQRKTTRTTVSERAADKPTHTTLEGPIELQKTETQDQKNLDDGVTVRRKVVTTRKIKKMTDITLANGIPTESKIREVLLGVDIEEHILHLPPGVIEPFGSNCDTNISVEESEEDLPEGVTAKKKIVTMVVTLKERERDSVSPVRASKHASLEMLLSPEDRTSTPDDVFLRDRLSERTVEKQIEVRKKVAEDQKNLDDGSTLRRKVITSDYIKPIWKVSLVDGREVESFVREELVNTEIEEHILQLPPGVIEPFGSNCETEISVETSEVTLPDGRMAKKKLVRMIVFLKTSEPADKRVSVTEEKPAAADERDQPGVPKVTHRIEEGQISSLVKVNETQQVLEDGSTVRRKVITTKFIRPVTDTTLVDGVETGTETREENIRTEIEEITLKLPAGVIEPYGSNLETETTVDQFDDTLPDGTPAKKKLVTIVVHLKEPVQPEKRESISDGKSKQPSVSDLDESKRKGRDSESAGTVNKVIEGAVSVSTEVGEGEDSLEDGTTIRRKTVTTRHFKPITKLTITDGVVTDAKMDEETVKMDIDETILELPPGVTDPKGDNLQTDTTVRTSQETTGGVVTTRRVTKKVVSVKYPLGSKQKDRTSSEEPLERETGSFETHTYRKSTQIRDKAEKQKGRKDDRETTLTIKKRVRTKIRRVNPDGEIVEDEFTEEEDLSDVDPSSVMDLHSIGSPTLISPSDSDVDSSAIKVYTDTVESDPVIERKVEEFEDTLPDGTLVRRRLIKTTQKKTIVKRVVMEGPEDELASAGEDPATKQLLVHRPGSTEPQLTRYTDVTKEEPDTETDLKESEEVMPDGTVVKKRVKTTTQQKLTTERTVLGGTLDDNALREIFKEGGGGAAGKALPTLAEEDRKSPKPKDKQDQKSGTPRKEQQERTSRLRLKKQVHKRTVVEAGREETVVVNKTHVDRSDDEPEELRDSIGQVIRELVESSSGSSGDESL